jgi:hypothetical protein
MIPSKQPCDDYLTDIGAKSDLERIAAQLLLTEE